MIPEIDPILTYHRPLEWEILQRPYKFAPVPNSPHLPNRTKPFVVSRDDQYKILGRLEGPLLHEFNDSSDPVGAFIEHFSLATSYGPAHCELRDCRVSGWSTHFELGPEGRDYERFRANLLIHELYRRSGASGPVASWVNWYLNGPHDPNVYSGATARTHRQVYTRFRSEVDVRGEQFHRGPSRSYMSDHVFVESSDLAFLLRRIPDELGPRWSSALGIEYRPEWGGIPDEETQRANAELVGFVLGCRLIDVGYTTYTSDGTPLEQMARSPVALDVVGLCRAPDEPPALLVEVDAQGMGLSRLGSEIAALLPNYVRYRDTLKLNSALYRYEASREVHVGVDLPLLAGALELISEKWFALPARAKALVNTEPERLRTLLQPVFGDAKARLKTEGEDKAYVGRIIGALKSAVRTSDNERVNALLRELTLITGLRERDARTARSIFVHGFVPETDAEVKEYIRHRQAYYTLVNRVLLKILGYEGAYVDYSSLGLPPTPIHEPLGSREMRWEGDRSRTSM